MINNKIAEKTYWVGKVDDRKVPFHRLILEKGTTYNSYLLDTEKPTIIDTVDIMYGGEFVKNLQQIIDLDKIHYVVINHVEPDHAGALPALLNKAKNATIVTTEKGREFLNGMFKLHSRNYLIIKDGDSLDIGGKTLKFFETPYLHTEETMITYCVEDKILYPCDIFSTHIANYELFDDLAKEDITEDFTVYYKLIMGPHRSYVRDMLDKVKDLDIQMIAPSHGFILRSDVNKYIKIYDELSKINPDAKDKQALILFSSMTGNTGKIAKDLADGFKNLGITTDIFNVKNANIEDIKKAALEANAILIGSSTKYGDMIGNLEEVLKELVALDLSNKLGSAFGSFGWSGEAVEIINDYIKESKMTLVDTSYVVKATGANDIKLPLKVNYYDNEETKDMAINAAMAIGELILTK
ncbi:FprA family A-type flavoprotein [Clostridium sp. CX1]|uniref:FprA family A-type flavoprotein n=1 Tax=Clostridium sp. CX1 TaxID=2978346 RepID=UPI0021BE9C22|nr:FprA family A-type flavoprotein [Clostridium sp. CX1]MCT8978766.1 FprA family A-type flavoprotein [Clostridium sp. CX1]